MANYFEALAEAQIPSPIKAKIRSAEKRAAKNLLKPTPLEKKQQDQAKQMSFYRQWKRTVKAEILDKHKSGLVILVKLLRNLKVEDHDQVVSYVKSAGWITNADEQTKVSILSYIDHAITRSRIRNGWPPYDDPIPFLSEELSPFLEMRKILTGV